MTHDETKMTHKSWQKERKTRDIKRRNRILEQTNKEMILNIIEDKENRLYHQRRYFINLDIIKRYFIKLRDISLVKYNFKNIFY